MATAATIVDDALIALGVHNELNPKDEYLEEQFFKLLIRLLNRWSSIGISLGITIPAAPANELNNPDDVEDALNTSLAIAGAKIAKVKPSRELRKDQKIYYREMKAAYGIWPEQSFSSEVPYGQGNNFGPRTKRYFQEPDSIASNSGNSIGA